MKEKRKAWWGKDWTATLYEISRAPYCRSQGRKRRHKVMAENSTTNTVFMSIRYENARALQRQTSPDSSWYLMAHQQRKSPKILYRSHNHNTPISEKSTRKRLKKRKSWRYLSRWGYVDLMNRNLLELWERAECKGSCSERWSPTISPSADHARWARELSWARNLHEWARDPNKRPEPSELQNSRTSLRTPASSRADWHKTLIPIQEKKSRLFSRPKKL